MLIELAMGAPSFGLRSARAPHRPWRATRTLQAGALWRQTRPKTRGTPQQGTERRSSWLQRAQASAAAAAEPAGGSGAPAVAVGDDWWTAYEPEALGPAAKATLAMLDWAGLTKQVSTFSQTKLGQTAVRRLLPAAEPAACQALLQETRAVDSLESEYAADLDFGGIQTSEVTGRWGGCGLWGHAQSAYVAMLCACQSMCQTTKGF